MILSPLYPITIQNLVIPDFFAVKITLSMRHKPRTKTSGLVSPTGLSLVPSPAASIKALNLTHLNRYYILRKIPVR
ncbi:MAG: hypothetical protein YK1309IOTA_310001 [Marine Group I thaumarchaeote]|nr:MAG: hypothetical protein NPMRIOTA_90003 [Nitrosopumilales archaeon]GFN39277.1 MAG: hypothetical protein YK1309IOTA_310001 [Marine Group I thaumarchaeote]